MTIALTPLFKQGIQDHDDGVSREQVAEMAFPDPETEGTPAYNIKAAHKEWLSGWDYAEQQNPMED